MKLAINGGPKVRSKPFPAYNSIGQEEKIAVQEVLDSGVLSKFLGCWHKDFYGGPEVQALEKEWAEYFQVKNAIAVNSCTSGLYCAVGATGVEPGEEIIVPPYTMSATATAPLIFNAIPVFSDIEEDYFCLDPNILEEQITSRTRAIMVVDLFGHPYDMEAINSIAKKHDLMVIEDCAQAPGARYKNKFSGTLGDVGVYSLNYHKHIHCGEGGVVVTDNDEIAEKIRLIRNHGEAVVGEKGFENISNIIGFNFRMTEIEATIARCQLRKLNDLLTKRQENCNYISDKLKQIPAITPPKIRDNSTHSFYLQTFKFDQEQAGIPRDRFIDGVRKELQPAELREGEGVLIGAGYVKPLYLQPMYQNKIAYGTKGYPFKSEFHKRTPNYNKGICPVTERMHEKELFTHDLMNSKMEKNDLDDVTLAFEKVWENKNELTESLVANSY